MEINQEFLKTAIETIGVAFSAAVGVGAYLKKQVRHLIQTELRPISKRLRKAENNHRILAQGLYLNLHKDGSCESEDCPCYYLERLSKEDKEEEEEDD
jgi:hypothetical protein